MNIDNLLNLDEQRLVLLCGLPGSGKSTIAKRFEDVGYRVVCTDTNRGIIASAKSTENKKPAEYESDQSVNAEAWTKTYADATKFLAMGDSVVIDAINLTRKARARVLSNIHYGKLPVSAVFMDTLLDTCIDRNLRRADEGGRYVPNFVIKTKWRTQTLPLPNEDLANVVVISDIPSCEQGIGGNSKAITELLYKTRRTITAWHDSNLLRSVLPSLNRAWGIDQDNKNHSLELHNHMITAAEAFQGTDLTLLLTMLLHDVGKVDTKQYFARLTKEYEGFKEGEKVILLEANDIGVVIQKQFHLGNHTQLIPHGFLDVDSNAHYYDHQVVGAMTARRDLLMNGFDEGIVDDVYWYILHHMDLPFRNYSESQLRKFVNRVGPGHIPNLVKIRYADKHAGAWNEDLDEFYGNMIPKLQEILNERGGNYVVQKP